MTAEGLRCCAIMEIDGLSYCSDLKRKPQPHEVIVEFCRNNFGCGYYIPLGSNYSVPDERFHCAFVIFSQAGKGASYGTDFAKFIETNNFGTVTASNSLVNPNSGNPVTVFVWELNQDALKDWWMDHGWIPIRDAKIAEQKRMYETAVGRAPREEARLNAPNTDTPRSDAADRRRTIRSYEVW